MPAYGSSTDSTASLNCRNSGSFDRRHQQGDPASPPDAADADHLDGRVDEPVAVEQHAPVIRQRLPIVAEDLHRASPGSRAPRPPRGERSAAAGRGCGAGRRPCRPAWESPSSEPLCLSSPWRSGRCTAAASPSAAVCMTSFGVDLRVPDLERIASPSSRAGACGSCARRSPRASRPLASDRPIDRAASTKEATSRLTSHSHGAGSVSSKSLMSKMMLRSGVAKPPKFSRWQSPHACTLMPVLGVRARSAAITAGGAAVEGERRLQHAAVADRHKVRQPVGIRRTQQIYRIRARLAFFQVACWVRGNLSRSALPAAARSSCERV